MMVEIVVRISSANRVIVCPTNVLHAQKIAIVLQVSIAVAISVTAKRPSEVLVAKTPNVRAMSALTTASAFAMVTLIAQAERVTRIQ